MERKVRIAGNEYVIRYGIRALFVFERLAQKSFEVRTLTDTYLFFYSMLLAGSPECGITFDSFVESCEADAGLSEVFSECVRSAVRVGRQFPEEPEEAVKKKRAKK
ncbi:MAG: hypothetical protein LBP50_01770 [Tannerella sp.]|jgi:hypothetical protein|nr:hypothetical protein [Tannerella sp.]